MRILQVQTRNNVQRWVGHVKIMNAEALAKSTYSSRVSGRGRPLKCWEDQIQDVLKDNIQSMMKFKKTCAKHVMDVTEALMVCQEKFDNSELVSLYIFL